MGLKIENLTKTYGDFKALNHVSLEVENGKILGIIKKNLLFFREIRSQLIGQKTKKDHKIYNSKYKINKVINHI